MATGDCTCSTGECKAHRAKNMLADTVESLTADCDALARQVGEMRVALERIITFEHHPACFQPKGCVCWELELHVARAALAGAKETP